MAVSVVLHGYYDLAGVAVMTGKNQDASATRSLAMKRKSNFSLWYLFVRQVDS